MIHSFAYRKPRMPAYLAVEYSTPDGVLFGWIRNISEEGLLVEFSEPVLPPTMGQVRFRTGHCLLELEAQVLHAEGFIAGLAFAFSSEEERAFVRAVLEALAKTADEASPAIM